MLRLIAGRKRRHDTQELTTVKLFIPNEKQVNSSDLVNYTNTSNSESDEVRKSADADELKPNNNNSNKISISQDTNLKSDSDSELETHFLHIRKCCQWRDIKGENLCLEFTQFYIMDEANTLLTLCERELVYNIGDLATVKLFGKRINIPRKQVAHGDAGLTYTFSGNTVPAQPWNPLLIKIRDQISQATGLNFNFVLINRYKDGNDYVGEHKDAERDLFPGYPIASLTLGQPRDFVFRHQDSRGKHAKRILSPVTIKLENGMLLLMKHPTNSFWYHSLPRRAKASGVRVNMTFRKMQPFHRKPA